MNRFKSLTLVYLLVLATLGGLASASTLEEADQLIISKNTEQIKIALSLLEDYLAKGNDDPQTLWLLAKGHLYLGDRSNQGDKLAIFEKGKEYAERAVELDSNSPDAHYWVSALTGRVGQTRGVMQSLFMVKPMRESLERVLELDENYADAYYVLSQLYQEAPGFPISIGNRKLALENAYQAVELDGENLDFQVQLAKALHHNKETDKAIKVLETLLKHPTLVDEPEIKWEVEELLVKWK